MSLGLRAPVLEWAVRSARGRLKHLRWVDPRLDTSIPPFRLVSEGEDDAFRHVPYLVFMPGSIQRAAVTAQRHGQATAWEGLALLFARPEWMVAARGALWRPYSPFPKLLAFIVERFGIEASLHQDEPDRLARLAAVAHSWHARRGRLSHAREVLQACDQGTQAEGVWGQDEPAPPEAVAGEVFACRSASWWSARATNMAPQLQITDGLLRFQGAEPVATQRVEDLMVALDQPLPRDLFRLMPVWADVRLTQPLPAKPPSRSALATTSEDPQL